MGQTLDPMQVGKADGATKILPKNGNSIYLLCLVVLASGMPHIIAGGTGKLTTYDICDTRDDHNTINHWNKGIESRNSVDLMCHLG